jgi:putative NIF3 family GTP cyclohydrolase 1 type 2
MTLKDLYEFAIKTGIEADPRGKKGVENYLAAKRKAYDEMPKSEQKEFDKEDLVNPYSDSRIVTGDLSLQIKKVMAGIDIDASEVLLADRLNEKGAGIDLIMAHHPSGGSLAALHGVMDLQVDTMAKYGVPVNVGEGLMRERIGEIERKISPVNHTQAGDAAKLLGLALICTHTITDNLVFDFLEKLIAKKKPQTVGDVLAMLKEQPEYQEAIKGKAGPMIFAGSPKNRAGRVAPLEITGGTDASHIIYEKLSQAGVGTIISMHTSEEHRKEAQKHHVNLVVAGHMSSDSLGMNLLLDKLEAKGIKVVPCSGLIRVKRSSKK